MKRTLIGTAIGTAILLAAIALPAQADSWRLITTSPEGEEFYLDDDSVRTSGDTVYFASLRVLPVPQKGIKGVRAYRSMSCARRVWRTRSITQYNQQKKVVSQHNPGDKGNLMRINSNTVAEDFYLELCR